MSLEPGRFGPFHLLEPLGQGGMGEVWLARALAVPGAKGALCVVKTVRRDVADDNDAVRRFQDESRLALLLVHPRIGRVIDAGSVEGTRFLALELVEGVDVLTLTKRATEMNRVISDDVALWIAACAFDALSFAHAARHPLTHEPLHVVHRDMSPHNLMCDATGSARVIDFGLALSTVKQSRTEQDIVLGKLAYMSPEQARGERVDDRCDIYATGVILYELLTRDRYWGKLPQKDIWSKAGHHQHKPAFLASLAPDIRAVLQRIIARDVKERATSAADCRDEVGGLLHARGGALKASRELQRLVEELAAPELQRIQRARGTAVASLSLEGEPEDQAPTTEESIAADEANAIAAAKALEAQTLQLPAFTTKMIEAAAARTQTGRHLGLALGNDLGPMAKTEAALDSAPARAAAAKSDAAARNDASPHNDDARTLLVAAVEPEGPPSVTARIPAARPAAAASRGRAAYAVVGALLAVAVVVALVVVVLPSPGAPPTPIPVATKVTPPPTPPVTTNPVTTNPVTTNPVVDPIATPALDPLDEALAALKGCKQICAKQLRSTSVDRLDRIRSRPADLEAVLGTARHCAQLCGHP